MYTQCPDCSTAFRVTADVLKQAAGKVRCGGCGNAFNALEYLSEQMPEQPAAKEAEERLPELRPEPPQSEERVPKAISAEQSAALLKTLDELAGSDIRIEDTGVEWRVLDDDAVGDKLDVGIEAAHGVDELLDESPTPVDQFLTKTPNDIDAREIFEESANAPAQTPVDELRFDDNTPLPDEFNLDEESSYLTESADADASAAAELTDSARLRVHPRDVDEAPVEIELGGREEWADILGEFAEPPEPFVHPLDAELEALEANGHDDASGSPEAAAPSDTPPDVDTQFALQAEAMGIELSGSQPALSDMEEGQAASDGYPDEAAADAEMEEQPTAPEEAAAAETDEAADEPLEAAAAETDEAADEPLEAAAAETDEEAEEPAADTAEDDEIELQLADDSGETQIVSDTEDTGEALQLDEDLDDESASPGESEIDDETQRHDMDDGEEIAAEQDDVDSAPLEFGSIEKAMAELEEESDVFDEDFFEEDATDTAGLEEDEIVVEDLTEADEADSAAEPEHVVPPQSEEEQTLNRLIDQELLSMAVEDEDGFASTIVVAEKDAEEALAQVPVSPEDEAPAGFESIIMEGEFVQSALDQEKRKADIAEAAMLAERARQAREAEVQEAGRGKRRGMAAAAVLLAVILVVQILHQSREALATIPVFNDTVGPIYRAIGMPLLPAWDISGFEFEATQPGPNGEDGERRTIYSRVGNTSDKPLPYPLINIAFVDRFDETVGSRTLEPASYLEADLDPREPVPPGDTFNAVISFPLPEQGVTGYRLRLCYRLSDGKLRCKNSDFR